MTAIIVFIAGLIIGSFLNVIIYRLPLAQSVIFPVSHCPHCRLKLAWYELIPLASYLLQQGKCRQCGMAVSASYLLVELLTGMIYLWAFQHYGFTVELVTALAFVSVLIPIIFIDLKHQIIPDTLNLTGVLLGLMTLPLREISVFNSLLAAVLGGTVLLLIAIISRGGMGGGDVKMMAWMGLFLGWKLTLLALFISFIVGGLGSLILILCGFVKRKDFIPFGPFLAVGGLTAYVFGYEILTWYFKTFIR